MCIFVASTPGDITRLVARAERAERERNEGEGGSAQACKRADRGREGRCWSAGYLRVSRRTSRARPTATPPRPPRIGRAGRGSGAAHAAVQPQRPAQPLDALAPDEGRRSRQRSLPRPCRLHTTAAAVYDPATMIRCEGCGSTASANADVGGWRYDTDDGIYTCPKCG